MNASVTIIKINERLHEIGAVLINRFKNGNIQIKVK